MGLVPDGVDVLWQTGSTDVRGLEIDARPWLPSADLEAAIADADVVISHAGGGSALAALMNGRRPILIPRRADQGADPWIHSNSPVPSSMDSDSVRL